ncbi:MAG: oligosaccharide flippase family protein, partial [Bacilli bacterium]
MKKSLFKNTIFKAILSFVNIVIPILVGPYVVKLLNVELYGIYNIVFSEFQVFLIFASFGLYTFGVREVSKIRNDKEKVSKLFSNLFIIAIISNTIICSIYILYSFLTSSGITLIIYLIMIIQFIGNTFYIEFINEALENYKFITIKTIIVKIIYIIAIFLFVRKPNNIAIYALIISLTVFLNNIISFIYAKKFIKFDFKHLNFKKYLKPLIVILVITNIDLLYSQLDRVMLGKFVGGVAVTMYYIPYFLVSTLASIPYAVINVAIPRLSYIVANESKDTYIKTLNKIISSLLFLIIPICLGMFVLAYEIIYLYAGNDYINCVSVLMIAC